MRVQGEVGGTFKTRLVPEAGCALLQRLISNVKKIHMLVENRQLQAAWPGATARYEIPYQRFNSSAFARLSQAAAAHLDCNLRVQNWRASTCLCGGK